MVLHSAVVQNVSLCVIAAVSLVPPRLANSSMPSPMLWSRLVTPMETLRTRPSRELRRRPVKGNSHLGVRLSGPCDGAFSEHGAGLAVGLRMTFSLIAARAAVGMFCLRPAA